MRALITLVFIALFASQLLAGNIDERKTDIYFANGVGAGSKFSSFMQGIKQIQAYKKANPSIKKWIGKYDLAFNTGHGVIPDFFEAWLQYTDENPSTSLAWSAFKVAIAKATKIGAGAVNLSEKVTRQFESDDIKKQVEAYEDSIKLGHGVLVLAHSQGNFFTNKAYNSLGGITPWMRTYFKTVGLASPSDIKIPHSSYLTYDNDPIHVLNGAGTIVKNSNRYYYWIAGPNVIVDNTSTVPCAPEIIPYTETPICHDPDWYFQEDDASEFHEFDYYMQTPVTQMDIYRYITEGINYHKGILTPSQWKIKTEKTNTNICEERRASLIHFEGAVDPIDVAFPFNSGGKVYEVTDANYTNHYVLGSVEGIKILDVQNPLNPTDTRCYELQDTQDKIFKSGCDMSTINPKPGVVTVSLNWDDPEIDLDLDVGWNAGTYDIKDVQCATEHFYIESEYSIYPGRYPVSVYNTKSVDESLLPETVQINITTPGESGSFILDINTSSELNIGHVADIKVEYIDNKPVLTPIVVKPVSLSFSNSVSSGGGGRSIGGSTTTSSFSGGTPPPSISCNQSCGCIPCSYEIIPYLEQALLGPLSGADVELHVASQYGVSGPIYTGVTSSGNTLYTAGIIYLDEEFKASLDDNELYIFTVSGGQDISN